MKKQFKIIVLTGVFILPLFLTGCLSRAPENYVSLELNFQNNQLTNNGKVFYVVVRQDTQQEFTSATYESVYNKFLDQKSGENIFIMPSNSTVSKDLIIPKCESVSLYFMFSSPGGKSWKFRISSLKNDETYNFDLGKNFIKNVNVS
jgi:hypothetical protein